MIAAIDPGLRGAIALFDDRQLVDIIDMPVDEETKGKRTVKNINAPLVVGTLIEHQVTQVVLERLGLRPKEGVVSAQKAGIGWGVIYGATLARGIPVHIVTPATWTKALGVGNDKTTHVRRACELWPTHAAAGLFHGPRGGERDGAADAALIGHWWLTQ